MIGQGAFGWFDAETWTIRIMIVCFCTLLLALSILMLEYDAEGPINLVIKLVGG